MTVPEMLDTIGEATREIERLHALTSELADALESALAVHGDGYSWGQKARAALAKARGQ